MKRIESIAVNVTTVFISAAIGAIAANQGAVPTDWAGIKHALAGAAITGAIAAYHWLATVAPGGGSDGRAGA